MSSECLKVFFSSSSKLSVLPVVRPCWPVADRTRPGSTTSTPTGGSILETTPPCRSTLNLRDTSPCLWARYSIQVRLIISIFDKMLGGHSGTFGKGNWSLLNIYFCNCRENHRFTAELHFQKEPTLQEFVVYGEKVLTFLSVQLYGANNGCVVFLKVLPLITLMTTPTAGPSLPTTQLRLDLRKKRYE